MLRLLFGFSLFCGCSKCFSDTFFGGRGGRMQRYEILTQSRERSWRRGRGGGGGGGGGMKVVGFPVRLITKMWM